MDLIELLRRALRTFAAEELPLPDRIRLGSNIDLSELRRDESDVPYLPFLYRGDYYEVPVLLDPTLKGGAVLELKGERYIGVGGWTQAALEQPALKQTEAEEVEESEERLFVITNTSKQGGLMFVGMMPSPNSGIPEPTFVSEIRRARVFGCAVEASEFADDYTLGETRVTPLIPDVREAHALRTPTAFKEWVSTPAAQHTLKRHGYVRREEIAPKAQELALQFSKALDLMDGIPRGLADLLE